MTDIVVDTLRLRGPHGRRLARVAARALPAALEGALADVDEAEIDELHVVLDLDPAEYDDETLAVLWADLIRASLVARSSLTVAPPSTGSAAGSPSVTEQPARDPASVARGWLGLPGPARTTVPTALLALGDQAIAVRVATELGPTGWARLVAALRRVLPGLDDIGEPVEVPTGGEVSGAPMSPESAAADRAGHGEPGDPGDPGTMSSVVSETTTTDTSDDAALAGVAGAADVITVVETLRELWAGVSAPVDPAAVTRCAGLVLLYPWLGDHCRLAEETHPGLDRYDVREAALAAVVADPSAADDPLVRLLAGRVVVPEARERAPLPRQEEVDDSAERVVASFAALLPGFERSTPGFVRDAWLVRLGVLDTDRSPVLLTAATHPLDVVLPLLPYPVELFKLPWSPALTVRFRP